MREVNLETILSIAEILGVSNINTEIGSYALQRLQRIADKLTKKPGEQGFDEEVIKKEMEADLEGSRALLQALEQVMAPPQEREYKIKRVAKGTRIEAVSPSGKNFSFGEVWTKSVIEAKGISLIPNNREKLNMHGAHVGVVNPEHLLTRDLCFAIKNALEALEKETENDA